MSGYAPVGGTESTSQELPRQRKSFASFEDLSQRKKLFVDDACLQYRCTDDATDGEMVAVWFFGFINKQRHVVLVMQVDQCGSTSEGKHCGLSW